MNKTDKDSPGTALDQAVPGESFMMVHLAEAFWFTAF